MQKLSCDIDWQNSTTRVILNPRLHQGVDPKSVERMLPNFPGHIWMATSGTTVSGGLKLVALSKKAMLISARSVSDHLKTNPKDSWFNVLPQFHVGGLSIYARSHVGQIPVFGADQPRWEARKFVLDLEASKATLSALVPTQVFDLVKNSLSAPSSLRAVVIGGGRLSLSLYQGARALGWPLLPSYGLTECCSQVATAPLSSLGSDEAPDLVRLNHVKLHTNGEGRLMISSESLLSAYAFISEERVKIFDPKESDWFVSEDLAELNGDVVRLLGRSDDRVKVLGELVDTFHLNQIFNDLVQMSQEPFIGQLIANPCPRKGNQVDLLVELSDLPKARKSVESFNEIVSSVEKIHHIYALESIPKTALGKVHRAQVRKVLGLENHVQN